MKNIILLFFILLYGQALLNAKSVWKMSREELNAESDKKDQRKIYCKKEASLACDKNDIRYCKMIGGVKQWRHFCEIGFDINTDKGKKDLLKYVKKSNKTHRIQKIHPIHPH